MLLVYNDIPLTPYDTAGTLFANGARKERAHSVDTGEKAMSRSKRITDKLVSSLVPPAKGNAITYDAAGAGQRPVSGFGVRITANGIVAFVMAYRNRDGRSRIITIGR